MAIETPPAGAGQPPEAFPGARGTAPRHYVFDGGALHAVPPGPRPAAAPGPLVAADSWLVDGGRVRALDRHRHRFAAACRDAAVPRTLTERLDAFWAAVPAVLPRNGRWFPRVQAAGHGTPVLSLLLRPAPPPSGTVRLWLGDPGDRRRTPRRKGPDLERLVGLRSRAVARGADECLLTTGRGLVLEGATTSLLWWEGERLCVPSGSLRVLPGVTSGLLVEHARELGVQVRHRRAAVGGLHGREVWAVNALHGLRPVVPGAAGTLPAGTADRAPGWQRWLRELAVPLPA